MADEADDLEYSESNVGLAQVQGVRKNISLKLKGKGRGRGRRGGKVRRGSSTKKASGNAEDENEEPTEEALDEIVTEKQSVDSNLEDVISKLETPAFSPMDRTFSEPLHQNKKLRWDHKVNLIGEKVIDPLIHCCEKCSLPILNYGRMLPCKHVFCYDCAKKADKLCLKCEEKIQRIEPSALGTVFMCTYGGTRHSPGSCGRTYLSGRDLQAHINHRHLKPSSTSPAAGPAPTPSSVGPTHVTRDPRDPRAHLQVDVSHQTILVGHLPTPQDHDHSRGGTSVPMGSPAGQSRQQPYPHSPANYSNAIPVSSARPNLITVPIQDEGPAHMHPGTAHIPTAAYASPGTAPPPPLPPPPVQHPGTAYTPHTYHATPSYSQAPPITTPAFSQPPPLVHHQSQMSGAVYSAPPLAVHHHPPRAAPMHPPPRFHEEGAASYSMQWGGGPVPPPPARASLPLPRPLPPASASNPAAGLLQPRGGPTDPAYRQPYYQ